MSIRSTLSRLEIRVPDRNGSVLLVVPRLGESSADATARAATERGRRAESFSTVTLVEFVSPGQRSA